VERTLLGVAAMKRRIVSLAQVPCAKPLSRRGFCAGSLAVIGLSACGSSEPRITVGGLDGDAAQANPNEDLAGNPADLATSHADLAGSGKPDLAMAGSCSGTVNAGAATAIVQGSPLFISASKMYVCRDAAGLYAMTSVCTHQGCKVTPEATDFYCSCHGATFDLNGQNPTSPAHSPLKHYALCVDASGDIEINPSLVVDPTTRA
jgi:Rieske Fe-S protein